MKVGPKYKICRKVGDSVFPQCDTPKFQLSKARKRGPRRFRRKQKTEYGTQLTEKQKVRYTYNISEKQLANYVKKAQTAKIAPTHRLYNLLESRLDNVIYRLGLTSTRAFARQVVSHGHILVNGRKTTIPSASVREGDIISVRPESKKNGVFNIEKKEDETVAVPNWVSINQNEESAEVTGSPSYEERLEANLDFDTTLEFYSRV